VSADGIDPTVAEVRFETCRSEQPARGAPWSDGATAPTGVALTWYADERAIMGTLRLCLSPGVHSVAGSIRASRDP
jgi:hypothetical protein